MTTSSAAETETTPDAPAVADALHGATARSAGDPPPDATAHADGAVIDGAAMTVANTPVADTPPARPEVTIRLFGRTDVGQVREHNEDNFIIADLTRQSRGLMEAERSQSVDERGTLMGVCDGMGGAAAGEVASQLAVDIIYQRMLDGAPPKGRDDLAARLVHAIEAAGLKIFSEAKADRTRRGMGTTATIAALVDDHLFFGQVGDSRAYIFRGDRLVQVTRDQSLVNQLIEAGQLTEEEAETFEHNNIILQALGTADSVQVDLTYVLLKTGDKLLMCSDGLSGMVRADELREVLRSTDDPVEVCKMLTDRANQAGGHDNITVVVAKFGGPSLTPPTREDIDGLRYQKYQLPEPPPAALPSGPESRARRGKSDEPAKGSSIVPPKSGRGSGKAGGGDELDDEAISSRTTEDPVHVPIDATPPWVMATMMGSALLLIVIAAYYLLR